MYQIWNTFELHLQYWASDKSQQELEMIWAQFDSTYRILSDHDEWFAISLWDKNLIHTFLKR